MHMMVMENTVTPGSALIHANATVVLPTLELLVLLH